jgi:hypothetical protein
MHMMDKQLLQDIAMAIFLAAAGYALLVMLMLF